MRIVATALTLATAALALVPGLDRRQSSIDSYITTETPIAKAGLLVRPDFNVTRSFLTISAGQYWCQWLQGSGSKVRSSGCFSIQDVSPLELLVVLHLLTLAIQRS